MAFIKVVSSIFLIFLISYPLNIYSTTKDEYLQLRAQTFQEEEQSRFGSSINLNSKEIIVNDILMDFKRKEYTEGLDSNGAFFGATRHFFHSKPYIEASNVFKIIKKLPKGAALHMHDVTVGSAEFVAQNLTKWDNLYTCTMGSNDHLLFRFFTSQPNSTVQCDPEVGATWKSVAEIRANFASSEGYVDNWFTNSMSMYTPTPEVDYPNTDRAWYHFETKITTISGVALYEPALKAYYYQVLKEFYEDNVQYIEMRGLLEGVYRLDQSELSFREALGVFRDVTDQFKLDYPDFWGAKFIFAPHRFHPAQDIQTRIDESVAMASLYSSFFAGFDLVGQEDKGTPLLGFLPQLLNAAERGVKFFFHSGETGWHGTKIDENLMDAVLLNTTRIGHGYALSFHPTLNKMVQEKDIGIEVCPISNQVLGLVSDFRNHPASFLMRDGFPLVIASDGPGMWASTGLSHDFYIGFMAMAGQHADLKFLKQVSLNSIKYSAMSQNEKNSAFLDWESKWSQFLDWVIQTYPPSKDDDKTNQVAIDDDQTKN